MEVSVTERYALLKKRASDIGCELMITLSTSPSEIGSRVTIVKTVPRPDGLEAALDVVEGWIADPATKERADLERRLRDAEMNFAVAGIEYATIAHQASAGIDKEINDALSAEGDAWQREQDEDGQDEPTNTTREDQS